MRNRGRGVLLLVLGTVWPLSLAAAEAPAVTTDPMTVDGSPAERTSRRSDEHPVSIEIRDISLDANGQFNGCIVDDQGRPRAGEAVVVSQGRKPIDNFRTDERGCFQSSRLRGGIYQISFRNGEVLLRVWKNGTAPKHAVRHVLLVTDRAVVRGQLLGGLGGSVTTLGVGTAVIAGVTFGVIESTRDDGKTQSSQQGSNSVFSLSNQNTDPGGTTLSFDGGSGIIDPLLRSQ